MNLIDIYRTFHPKITEHTFFSSAHGTFSGIDHILGHKLSLDKFEKIEIISSIFSNHNAMRLDINYKKKTVKNTNTWRLNNMLLNNQDVTEEIKEEIKQYLETNDNENMTSQNLWECSKTSSKREVYSNTIIPEETRKISNKQPNLTLKAIRERRKKETLKVSRRKKIIKIRSEINEKEMKETIAKINKPKSLFFEKINKVDKPLAKLIKKKSEKTQINSIRNGKGEVTTDTEEIQKIIRDYYKQLYAKKMDNLEEMDKLLEKHNLPRLNQEEIENINRPITNTEIETVIKKSSNKQKPRTRWLHRRILSNI